MRGPWGCSKLIHFFTAFIYTFQNTHWPPVINNFPLQLLLCWRDVWVQACMLPSLILHLATTDHSLRTLVTHCKLFPSHNYWTSCCSAYVIFMCCIYLNSEYIALSYLILNLIMERSMDNRNELYSFISHTVVLLALCCM